MLECRWGFGDGWNYMGAEAFPQTFKIGGVKIK